MGKLEGKIAIITGATSGIGRRSVEIFVEERAPGFWRPAGARSWAVRSKPRWARTNASSCAPMRRTRPMSWR